MCLLWVDVGGSWWRGVIAVFHFSLPMLNNSFFCIKTCGLSIEPKILKNCERLLIPRICWWIRAEWWVVIYCPCIGSQEQAFKRSFWCCSKPLVSNTPGSPQWWVTIKPLHSKNQSKMFMILISYQIVENFPLYWTPSSVNLRT